MNILQATKNFIYKLKALKSPKRSKFNFDNSVLDVAIGYNQYGAYCFPSKAYLRPAVQNVMRNAIYEPDTIKFISNVLAKNNGDIVHAGTFFGDFLPALSKSAIGSKQKIWAFEPNVESYKCAQITLLLNNIKNVVLTNAGLGNDVKTEHLLIKDDAGNNIGGASHLVNEAKNNKTQLVSIVKIDDAVSTSNSISLIQLDVEGYELNALKGALKTIKQHLPVLILEDNANAIESEWFKNNILILGYSKTTNLHSNKVFSVK